jgi:hypothetical protein
MSSTYIAYGGGVGSSALILKNLKKVQSGELEVIFVNHGADLPETYDYVKNIQQDLDIEITIRRPDNLYDYCWYHRILPSIHWRWCTDKFKIRPLKKYAGNDIPIIGLSFDERWRARDFQINGRADFPLITHEITKRQALLDFKEVSIPCKSGCFFCPFQSKEQWRLLFFNHSFLFLKALLLEDRCRERNPKIWLYEGLLKNLDREFKEQKTFAELRSKQGEQE